MTDRPDFSDYLESIAATYAQWWKSYAFMDEIDEFTWFEFELDSKTQDKPKQPGEKPQEKIQLVLQAIAEYAHEKILIVGSPGAGKSTLLARIIGQAAQRAQQNEVAPIPVLVELKLYGESGIWELIQTALENCDLYLEIPEIKQLIEKRRLLLLADGFNELPTDRARTEFKKFCGRNIPIIVTSRDAADGLGLERKLDLQPPSSQQVARFLEERLPNSDRAKLQELGDRVRGLGQTPLIIWMLYSIFRAKREVPETRGEAYRAFTTLYAERAKEGIDLTESRILLSKLASEMMQSQKPDDPTDFRLEISEVDAEMLLGSEQTLKRLMNHLLQWQGKPGNRKIRFCHQSLQEYYAAEWLLHEIRQHPNGLKKLPDQDYTRLQMEYLNLQKWTEPIALMLALVEDKGLAVRVVELAIGVDLMLGARLAGKVRSKFQGRSVKKLVERCTESDVCEAYKIQLLGETSSEAVVSELSRIVVRNPSFQICIFAIFALEKTRSKKAIPALLTAFDNPNEYIWTSAAEG
jgi:predicted NACHT family NTPase